MSSARGGAPMSDINTINTKVKIGLEIHQQLDTKKLFCNCPSSLSDGLSSTFERFLRVTESETGEVDRAALYEYEKGRKYVYQCPEKSSCLVEMDEEPPHEVNKEALEIALTIARMLNARVVDVICFMRKIVIDGSNTSGFQRTALIATEGKIDGVGIATMCLEEDSARKVKETNSYVCYNIDRLGVPLIEIATKPEIKSPEEAQEIALKIGMTLRRAKVKRGLGTIRQDLNISTSGMDKVEIKGVQKLSQIAKVLSNEIERQKNLLKIKNELEKRVKNNLLFEVVDLTKILESSESNLISKGSGEGKGCFALPLKGFKGLLSKGGEFRIAKELMSYAGIKGMLHGDELPGYGINGEKVDEIRNVLNLGDKDSFIIIIEKRERAEKILKKVFERALLCFDGVVGEVRKSLGNGYTEYMRPMPGSARMYPETDVPHIPIDREYLANLKLPETVEERIGKLKALGANDQQCQELLSNGYDKIFEDIARKFHEPKVILRVLNNTIPELEDMGCDSSLITPKVLTEVFNEYKKGNFGKEAISQILRVVCEKRTNVSETIESLGLRKVDVKEIKDFIAKLVEENEKTVKERGERSFKVLMGSVMGKYRGRVDGALLSKLLSDKIKEVLNK